MHIFYTQNNLERSWITTFIEDLLKNWNYAICEFSITHQAHFSSTCLPLAGVYSVDTPSLKAPQEDRGL